MCQAEEGILAPAIGKYRMMKTNEINIRDPYILLHDDRYYLYGTRSASCWGPMDGFDCYVSDDLENWSGPVEIFHNHGDFWADNSYWAPECCFYQNAFYLVATFGSKTRNKGIQVLRSESPTGPFTPHSPGPVTPAEWVCIDGTLYFDRESKPFLIFSLSFETDKNGGMYGMELTADLKAATGVPQLLFNAAEAGWPVPIPFAKEMGVDGIAYLSDGPCLFRTPDGKLLIIWSSWSSKGYAVGMAVSDNNELDGKWQHLKRLLVPENGGHGMMFRNKNHEWMYTYHYPNDFGLERPRFIHVEEHQGIDFNPISC